ncbi:MAG: two-component system, OmpR family, sensor kinase [Kribbellaceae bacterium]|jgi:signal transduction histidine kinase|nr:two-component system, OmpR family, sensor kinase [Kribbellaceae bacterium]
MSVISFRARESRAVAAELPRPGHGSLRPGFYPLIDGLLAVYTVTMLVLMQMMIEREVIPYHLLFLGLTLVYGFRVWPLKPTLLVTLVITAATGWILVRHQLRDGSSRAEWAEIPLMPMLFLAMVWHARRRVAALQQVEVMAEERLAVFDREREFFRDASHAMRTPVTIARGHLELLEPTVSGSQPRKDLATVLRQVDRLASLSTRLMALAKLDSGRAVRNRALDLTEVIREVGKNWRDSADREWVIEPLPTMPVQADPEWLELALDALIENAVHFTADGGRIRLSCAVSGPWYVISVADSGPGIRPQDLPHVFERFWHWRPASMPTGSGLGLPMALATVRALGGQITASTAPEGGALFELTLPRPPSPDSAEV